MSYSLKLADIPGAVAQNTKDSFQNAARDVKSVLQYVKTTESHPVKRLETCVPTSAALCCFFAPLKCCTKSLAHITLSLTQTVQDCEKQYLSRAGLQRNSNSKQLEAITKQPEE